jgi:hypothetical protein
VSADIVSGALIAGFAFEIPTTVAQVNEYLRRFGPLEVAGNGKGAHVVTCEVWRVSDGRPMPGGMDQHDAVARWGSFAGGLTGAMWGAAMGLLSTGRAEGGAFAAAGEGARRGFMRGSDVVARYARDASQRAVLGPYHELLIGVPDVCFEGSTTRYTAVLAMVTDDAIAESVDRIFGYGYDKKRGRFSFAAAGTFEVRVQEHPLIHGSLQGDGAELSADHTSRVNARWTQPFLGGLHDGSFRVSRLERRVDSGERWRVRGDVTLSPDAIPIPFAGTFSASAAVAFTGVTTRISRAAPIGR